MADYTDLVSTLRECSKHGTRYGMAVIYMEQAAEVIEELSHDYEKLAEDFNGAVELLHKREKPRWIPVTERLPSEELAFYLCYTDAGIVVECLWTNNKYGLGPFSDWGWRLVDVPQYQKVTHWMPLPEPPKEET